MSDKLIIAVDAQIAALVAGLEAYLARIEIKSDETQQAPGKD